MTSSWHPDSDGFFRNSQSRNVSRRAEGRSFQQNLNNRRGRAHDLLTTRQSARAVVPIQTDLFHHLEAGELHMLQRLIPIALVAVASFVFTDDASARHRRRCCCRVHHHHCCAAPACGWQTAAPACGACGGGCANGACGFTSAAAPQACCGTQVVGHDAAYAPGPMQPENAPAPPQEASPPPAPVPPNGR